MRTTASALLAAAALGLTACGGSGDDAANTPTRAEFIAKIDAQCKASNTRTKALNIELDRASAGVTDDAQLMRTIAPILEQGYGSIRDNAAAFEAATPPSADAKRIETLRKLYDEQAELVRKLAAAAKASDVEEFKSLIEHQKEVVKRARGLAQAYGFEECGSSKSDAS